MRMHLVLWKESLVTFKTWLHDQEMIIFCAEKLVKSANYVSNVFFGKEMNIICY